MADSRVSVALPSMEAEGISVKFENGVGGVEGGGQQSFERSS